MRTLFICKKNENYGYSTTGKRSGLYNSTRFIAEALNDAGIDATVIDVVDNNAIDREVSAFKPDVVVIEALWVVPEKFDVLKKLHPKVKWCVHLHSNAPFLAYEGIAVDWIRSYSLRGVTIIVNSAPAKRAVDVIAPCALLENVYHCETMSPVHTDLPGDFLHIGCFGAIRPMKNQFTQALAAIKFSKQIDEPMNFFVNASRSETGGDPVLKNLRALFLNCGRPVRLVECGWMEHDYFIDVLRHKIDIGMQVSLSETFNIVTADCVTAGVPVVTSDEVSWVAPACQVRTDDVDAIVEGMARVYGNRKLVQKNRKLLAEFSARAAEAWIAFITGETKPLPWHRKLFR